MTARLMKDVSTEGLLTVLAEGEAYVRSIGRPGWRAGLLQQKARVLNNLGRRDEAIGVAEEALSLELRDGGGPGSRLPCHRWSLGDLLRNAGRHDDARGHYQAVVDDSTCHPYDRMAAVQGLARCALAAGDAALARKHAAEAVRLSEGMGDNALAPPLAALVAACLAEGDLPAARAAAERSLQGARRLGDAYRLYFALRNAADVALDEKDAARARAFVDEAEPHAEALDRQRGSTTFRGDIQRLRERLAKPEKPEDGGA